MIFWDFGDDTSSATSADDLRDTAGLWIGPRECKFRNGGLYAGFSFSNSDVNGGREKSRLLLLSGESDLRSGDRDSLTGLIRNSVLVPVMREKRGRAGYENSVPCSVQDKSPVLRAQQRQTARK